MNNEIFYAIYGFLPLYVPSFVSILFDMLVLFFASFYVFVMGLVCVIIIMSQDWSSRKKYVVLLSALGAGASAILFVTEPIRFVYPHPRPFVALHLQHLLTVTSSSFPSGHTIFVFAIATVLYFYHKRLAYFAYASGLVIGVSRVMAGVHYPLDILGGIVLGVLVGYAVVKLTQHFGLLHVEEEIAVPT